MNRNSTGAAVGKIVLPTIASTAPDIPRMVGNHQPLFQVYLLHSWRFGANEVARPFMGKLAQSCLMGARNPGARTARPSESAYDDRLKTTFLAAYAGASNVLDYDALYASILETRQSAVYSSQHRKKNPKQPGESALNPSRTVAYWDGCCQALSRQFKGILSDVALHAAKRGKP
jgi:hypothetical protein